MILKNLNYKIYIKIMFLFIIFIFFFYTNVFATRLDGKEIDGTSNKKILVKSDFEGGYVKFTYKIKTLEGYVDKDIKYYKFVYAKDAAGKKTPLWLYNHSVSTYDVEIKNAQTSGKVPEFYINGAKVDDTLFCGQYYMWPISNVKYDGKIVGLPKQKIIDDYISVSKANGDKANTDLGKLVIKHNINDWTQISKPENYILMYMIPENTGNTGFSYKNEYVIKKVPSKDEAKKIIKKINDILGTKYSTSKLSQFFTTSRFGETMRGYKINSQTWLNKSRLTVSDSLKQKNTAEGFTDQSSMVITYKSGNKTYHGIMRHVYNPDIKKVGEITGLVNFPRDMSETLNWNTIVKSYGIKRNPLSYTTNLSEGLLNRDYRDNYKEILKNKKSEYDNPEIEAVTPEMVRTFNAACKTWKGYYEYWAKIVAGKNWKVKIDDDTIIIAKNIPKTISGINKLGKVSKSNPDGYKKWYVYMQMCFLVSLDYVEYSNYASEFTECVLGVSRGQGTYNTFTTARIKENITDPTPLITNNVNLRNTTVNMPIKVIDLYKVFDDISEERKAELMNATSIDEGKNRGEKLIIATYLDKNVGAYLTPTEIEKGEITYDDNFQYKDLKVNYPYLVFANLKYTNGFKNSNVAKDHDIRDYFKDGILPAMKDGKSAIFSKISTEGFALYQEQFTMTESDPQMQFMMVISDSKLYDTSSKYNYNKIRNTGRLYLSKEKGLYEKIDKTPKTKQKYFIELFEMDSKGNSTYLTNQKIRFKNLTTDKRINGIVQIDTKGNGRYFEFIQVDFSTSLYHAYDKIVKRSMRTKEVAEKLIEYQNMYGEDVLIPINNKYDTAAKTLYGYWKLRADDYTGKYSGAENFYYCASFVIPKYAPKVVNGKLYYSDETGKKDTSKSFTMYGLTGQKTTYTTSVTAKETKGVKFMARIATDDDGDFEQDFKEVLKNYSSNKAFNIMKELTRKIKLGEQILGIRVLSTSASQTDYYIVDEIANINFTATDADKFRQDLKAILSNHTETPNKALHFTVNNAKLSEISLTDIVNKLPVQELFAIFMNMYVDDNNAFDNQSFIVFNVNITPEDILISNSRNGYDMNKEASGLKVMEQRKTIDWAGNSSQYNMITTLSKDDTTNILNNDYKVKDEYVEKIDVKDYDISPSTNATTIYTKLYVGRIPEAKAAKGTTTDPELTLADFKVILTENINVSEDKYKATENANKKALESLITSLNSGATETKLKNIFNSFKTSYTPTFLTKIYLGKSITDYSYITIKPVRYKEMKDAKIQENSKATNVVMDDWKSIPNNTNLSNIKVKPGTIIEYEATYTLPNSNSVNTTWKYIKKYLGNYFKDGQTWYTNYTNLNSVQLNYTLVPTATLSSDKYVGNKKFLTANSNLLNDWATEYMKISSDRNLYFTKVEVVDSSDNVVASKTIPHNSGIGSALLEVNPKVNSQGKYENLYIKVYMKYENEANRNAQTINSNIKAQVSNSFYPTTKKDTVAGTITGKMTPGDENKYGDNKPEVLKLPLNEYAINPSIEQEVRITIPSTYDVDNSRHDDCETIVVKVTSKAKDNEISDIILYKNNFNNATTYGNVSRSNPYSDNGNQPLSKTLNESYYAVVKVKRNTGDQKEDNGYLYVEVYYNGKDKSNGYLYKPNGNGIFTAPNITQDGAVALNAFDAPGEYMYYGFPITSAQVGTHGITNLVINAEYRVGKNISETYHDKEDINTSNNVWTERWSTGFNFYATNLQAPADMRYDKDKGGTDQTEISFTFTAGLNCKNSIYDNGTRTVTLNLYQIKDDGTGAGTKIYPKEVKGTNGLYNRSNGTLKIEFNGDFEQQITAVFDKQVFTKGLYKFYADININPAIANIYEDTTDDNITTDTMNVFEDDRPEPQPDPCKTIHTYNEWKVQFRWSNYEYANPRYYHYNESLYDSEGRYIGSVERCGCSCNNRSGVDNGKSNWGPDGQGALYWEKHYIEAYIWTSSSNKNTLIGNTWTGLNKTAQVKTGESFYVFFKAVHESNRSTLPNAPSGRAPFQKTYATHLGYCDYLTRSPGVSTVAGPTRARITVSGVSYGIDKMMSPTSTEKSETVNKTFVYKPLPKVQVPITNKNQTITYKLETETYNGHTSDSYHPRKGLCTELTVTVKIVPSGVVVGGDETDNNIGQSTEAWVE